MVVPLNVLVRGQYSRTAGMQFCDSICRTNVILVHNLVPPEVEESHDVVFKTDYSVETIKFRMNHHLMIAIIEYLTG